MDAERPERVLVRPDDAEVLAVAVDVEHVAQLARVDELLELLRRPGGRAARWPGISTRSRSSASATRLVDLGCRHRRRLLDEHVLAGLERLLRELGVRGHGRRDDDRVERVVGEQIVEVGRRPAACGKRPRMRSSGAAVRVADPARSASVVEVPREVGAPVAEARPDRDLQSFQTLSELRPVSPVALRKSTTSWASATTRS